GATETWGITFAGFTVMGYDKRSNASTPNLPILSLDGVLSAFTDEDRYIELGVGYNNPLLLESAQEVIVANASDAPGNFNLGNLSFELTAAPIPEPSTWALMMGLGAGAFVFLRRRRK